MAHSLPIRGVRWSRVALASLLALGVLGACGDDGGSTDDGGGSAAAATDEKFCAAALKVEQTPPPEIDFDSATEEERAAAIKAYLGGLEADAEEAAANAPDEIEADVKTLVKAIADGAESGTADAIESDEYKAAEAKVADWEAEHCGWNTQEVEGVDYAFRGVPSELEAGTTMFRFENGGEELHEMIVFKLKDADDDLDEILTIEDEAAAMERIDFVQGIFAEQGKKDSFVADLEAGTYAMVCFIPVGTTSQESEAEGPPHFQKGMKATFRVT